jgi:hypothetical protein
MHCVRTCRHSRHSPTLRVVPARPAWCVWARLQPLAFHLLPQIVALLQEHKGGVYNITLHEHNQAEDALNLVYRHFLSASVSLVVNYPCFFLAASFCSCSNDFTVRSWTKE